MKNVIFVIFNLMMRIVSVVYPYSLHGKIKLYRDVLYTLWIKNILGELGERSIISFPCNVQGGGSSQIKIGDHSHIKKNCVIGCWATFAGQKFSPAIKIGNYCTIGEYCHISAINEVVIGDGTLTGRFVFIGDNSHGNLSWSEADIPPSKRKLKSKGGIVIGYNVWIGDKATILSGVHVGDNVVIAANSVVTSDLPSHCVAGGVPAKVIKQLMK